MRVGIRIRVRERGPRRDSPSRPEGHGTTAPLLAPPPFTTPKIKIWGALEWGFAHWRRLRAPAQAGSYSIRGVPLQHGSCAAWWGSPTAAARLPYIKIWGALEWEPRCGKRGEGRHQSAGARRRSGWPSTRELRVRLSLLGLASGGQICGDNPTQQRHLSSRCAGVRRLGQRGA